MSSGVLFQVVLIVSGNLSFLNWLTLVPAVMSFDDKTLGCLFSVATRRRVIDIQYDWKTRRKPISESLSGLFEGIQYMNNATGNKLQI